jgi:hypothetical protein
MNLKKFQLKNEDFEKKHDVSEKAFANLIRPAKAGFRDCCYGIMVL